MLVLPVSLLAREMIIESIHVVEFKKKKYTEQKKKGNIRSPRSFKFQRKTMIISGLLLPDSYF